MLAGRSPFDIVGATDNPDQNTEDYLFQVTMSTGFCITLVFQVILEKTIRIPRSLSVKAASILKGFLNKNPADRLGCHRDSGFGEIMNHPFFKVDFRWKWWSWLYFWYFDDCGDLCKWSKSWWKRAKKVGQGLQSPLLSNARKKVFLWEVFPYIAIFEIQLILPDNRMGDARAKADSASISSKARERKRSRQLPPWGSFWSHVFLSAILITFFWEKIFSVHGWAGATNPGWPWHHWKDWPDRIRGIRVRFWSKLIIAPPLLTIILV